MQCDCICGGRNHGAGKQQALDNTRELAESWVLLILAAAVLLGLAAVDVAAAVAWRVRQQRPETPRVVHQIAPAPWQAMQTPSEPPPAIEQHVHFHGLSAEDVAAIIERGRQE